MGHRFQFIVALGTALAILGAWGANAPSFAQESLAAPGLLFAEQGLLLLTNGEVLEGRITREGDRYLIVLPHGEIRLSKERVAHHGRDLPDCYQHLRSRLAGAGAGGHLELARWCARHGLVNEAVEQLQAAQQISPNHPQLGVVARQILLREAGALEPTGERSAVPEDPYNAQAATDAVRALPPGVMESFVSTIQPTLLNHCSAAACHGFAASNDFRLYRAVRGGAQSTRMTQMNLLATLKQVRREHPLDSPLWRAATAPHPHGGKPIFPQNETAMHRNLADWLRKLGPQETAAAEPSSVDRDDVILSQSPARRPSAGETLRQDKELRRARRAEPSHFMPMAVLPNDDLGAVQLVSGEEPLDEAEAPANSKPSAEPADADAPTLPPNLFAPPRTTWRLPGDPPPSPTTAPRVMEELKPAFTPRDDFDPEIFNRRHHSAK